MPKSKVRKSRKFREFSKLDDRYIRRNYLKYYRTARLDFCDDHEISGSHLDFLVWTYDLEFWTLDYASKDYKYNKKKLGERVVYDLVKSGYLYKHFNRLTPSNSIDDHLFREETKYNYRVRYALSQKGRLLVQRYYNYLESQHED